MRHNEKRRLGTFEGHRKYYQDRQRGSSSNLSAKLV